MRAFRFAVVVSILSAISGCPSCAPDLVGQGIARLTVRNVGAMVTLASANEDCGFASPEVLENATVEGEVGGPGSLTLKVAGCTIDAGSGTDVSEDCTGDKTTAKGRFTLTATRTIVGTLTGNAANPIVPGSADAVTIKIERVEVDDFAVEKSDSDDSLRMISGSLAVGSFKPRLGVDETSGACAIPTPVLTANAIAYKDAVVFVKTPDNEFEADVETSSFSAQNGRKGDQENSISGTMTVFGSEVEVTGDGVLDSAYVRSEFEEDYACTENLAGPTAFACGDLDALVANGAARLTVKAIGTVVGLLDANDACGFSNGDVLAAGLPTGTVGGDGSITFTVTDCTINLGATPVELEADCNGNSTVVSGSVVVSGTKTVTGRFTGNPATPVVPDSDLPASFTISAVASSFSVGSTNSENQIEFENGTLSGSVSPRTALAADTGACSYATPNATLADIAVVDADVVVRSTAGVFSLHMDEAALDATNGVVGAAENALVGTVTVGENVYDVPADGAGLDPEYDADAFIDTFGCAPDLVPGPVYACQFAGPIGIGAAQLTMRTLGSVAKMLESNAIAPCGFASAAVAGTPVFTGPGGVGDDGQTATFTIGTACTVTVPDDTPLGADCLGNLTTAGGSFTATGTKGVTGFQTGNPFNPVVPTSRDPATVQLSITFNNFVVESETSSASLLIKSGTLTGTVAPRVALDVTTGACSISTPNVAFSDVVWTDADVTLVSDGSTFDFVVDTAALSAQNGTTETASNVLSGAITVDGVPVNVPADMPLDPAFDQAAFDSTYLCDPDADGPAQTPVLAPNEATCSFRTTLGNAAARLLVKSVAVGTIASNDNPGCGFDATLGTETGTPGSAGTYSVDIAACATPFGPTPVAISETCPLDIDNNTQTTNAAGSVTTSGTKAVVGFLTGQAAPSNIVPLTRDGVTFTISDLTFGDFRVFDSFAGAPPDTESSTTGSASAVVTPILGQSIQTTTNLGGTPAYTITVPIAEITDVQMTAGTMTVVSDGNTFNVSLADVDLDAFNGSWSGTESGRDPAPPAQANQIAGSLVVDGVPVTLPVGSPLDPAFNSLAVTASYACNLDLEQPVPGAP